MAFEGLALAYEQGVSSITVMPNDDGWLYEGLGSYTVLDGHREHMIMVRTLDPFTEITVEVYYPSHALRPAHVLRPGISDRYEGILLCQISRPRTSAYFNSRIQRRQRRLNRRNQIWLATELRNVRRRTD